MGEPRTVRVRIAVAVDETGGWASAGWRMATGKKPEKHDDYIRESAMDGVEGKCACVHWVEADIPIPQTMTHVVEPTPDGEVEG